MRPGRTACCSDTGKILATLDHITYVHIGCRQMAIHGDQALAMVQEHRFPIEKIISHYGNHPIGRCLHGCALWHSKVQPRMRVAFLTIKKASYPECTGKTPANRLI